MLTCRELSEMATDYLERDLGLRQYLAVRLHLSMCRHCRAYVDQLAKTVALLKAGGAEALEVDIDPRLVAMFRKATAPERQ